MLDLIRNRRRSIPLVLAMVLCGAGSGPAAAAENRVAGAAGTGGATAAAGTQSMTAQRTVERTAAAEDVAALVARQDVEGLRSRGRAVLPELLALYRRSDAAGRANIAWLLYHLGWESETARTLLMADVHTDHDRLRVWAQYALGRVSRDDSVVDVLLENLERTDDKWLYRDKAACGLAYDQIHLTEPQKVRLFTRLIRALGNEDPGTRSLVIQVLAVHTGQTKGYDPNAPADERGLAIERWWRWLAEYRTNVEGTG